MFTRKFFADLAERAVATFAQTFLALVTVDGVSVDLHVDLGTVAVASLTAAAFSALKSLAATRVGAPNTAALLPAGPDTDRG